jgi:hypothetical protein
VCVCVDRPSIAVTVVNKNVIVFSVMMSDATPTTATTSVAAPRKSVLKAVDEFTMPAARVGFKSIGAVSEIPAPPARTLDVVVRGNVLQFASPQPRALEQASVDDHTYASGSETLDCALTTTSTTTHAHNAMTELAHARLSTSSSSSFSAAFVPLSVSKPAVGFAATFDVPAPVTYVPVLCARASCSVLLCMDVIPLSTHSSVDLSNTAARSCADDDRNRVLKATTSATALVSVAPVGVTVSVRACVRAHPHTWRTHTHTTRSSLPRPSLAAALRALVARSTSDEIRSS